MLHFKDTNDGFYAAANATLVPQNCVEITAAEFLVANPLPTPSPLEKIRALEAANPITHRNLRDLSMTVAQIAGAVTGTDPMVNPAVKEITTLEAQIAVLRAQIP